MFARQTDTANNNEELYLKIYDSVDTSETYKHLKLANFSMRKGIKLAPPYDQVCAPKTEDEDAFLAEMDTRRSLRLSLVTEIIKRSDCDYKLNDEVIQQAIDGARVRSAANYGSDEVVAGMYQDLPDAWEEKLEQPSGRPFYVDHNTFTTQLEDPRPLPACWEQKISDKGWAYFVDHLAKTSYWTHPCSTRLPPKWQQLYDEDHKLYYVNHSTKLATYVKPAVDYDASAPSSSKDHFSKQIEAFNMVYHGEMANRDSMPFPSLPPAAMYEDPDGIYSEAGQ